MEETTQPEQATTPDDALAEAEQRGYLRGLNEAAAKQMAEPTMYEWPSAEEAGGENHRPVSLGPGPGPRRSFWD